jgi:acyl-[acyl-carrier-protein]-phospholipid O-acyltransferase/long-chain-fatty-acid--[acyl-carrier-protein] ligase
MSSFSSYKIKRNKMDKITNKTCKSSSFKAFMCTQALGAFNDNIFKIVFSLYVVNLMLSNNSGILHLIIINFCFVSPFILFSTIAGSLADKYPKNKLIVFFKLIELLLMCVAGILFYFQNIYGLFIVLFLMGLQSTFFSPAKYGLIPEIIKGDEISKANGFLELWTFVAIILGTGVSGLVVKLYSSYLIAPGAVLILCGILGFLTSFKIEKTKSANKDNKVKFNPFTAFSVIKEIKQNRSLFLTLIGLSYFWSIALLYQLNIILFAKQESALNDVETSIYMLALGLGIGIGSVIAGKVSNGKVELGLVPIGSLSLSFCSLFLYFSVNYFYICFVLFLLAGISAGFFVVPLASFLQKKSPLEKRGSYLATANFCFFSCMLLISVILLFLIDYLKLNPSTVFLLISISTVFTTYKALTFLPEMFFRCINWILIHSFYKVSVTGIENIPKNKGALIVCNHVSYIDAQLILSATDRSVRFLMYKPIYENKLINFFAKSMQAIPIEAGGDKEANKQSLINASKAIDNGHLVCIFAEGQITRDGNLNPFKRGLEIIMEKTEKDSVIIPVAINQVWGSIFSFSHGKVIFKKPKKIPYPVDIEFGEELSSSSSREEVEERVRQLLKH